LIVDCPSLLVDCCLNVTATVFVVLTTAAAAANAAAAVVSSGVAASSPSLASLRDPLVPYAVVT
jgi:hypothetical protein